MCHFHVHSLYLNTIRPDIIDSIDQISDIVEELCSKESWKRDRTSHLLNIIGREVVNVGRGLAETLSFDAERVQLAYTISTLEKVLEVYSKWKQATSHLILILRGIF